MLTAQKVIIAGGRPAVGAGQPVRYLRRPFKHRGPNRSNQGATSKVRGASGYGDFGPEQ